MSTSQSTPATSVITPTDAQLKCLKTILKMANELASSWGVQVESSGRKGGKAPKAAKASSDKPKRTLNPDGQVAKLNVERMAVFTEMREAWLSRFPQFSEQARAAWAQDASGAAKKAFSAAVKAAGVDSAPMFADALKEHSRRRAADNSEAAAKHAAYRAKVEAQQAERKSQASGSKDSSSVVSAPAVTESSGKGKRKAQTPEQKAAAKAARDAKKAATKAPVPVPVAVPEPTPVVETSVVKADDGDEEAFKTWHHKDKDYFKNGLNYVYSKNSKGGFGDYVGQYDPVKRKIDTSVPEPDADSDSGSDSD
jgi:hypothetical protein